MGSVRLSSIGDVIDLLKPVGDDCIAYMVSPDWPQGTLVRLGFSGEEIGRCASINLVCNFSAGNVCEDEIRTLLENGARVFDTEAATSGFWALVADDIESSESDPYCSMTYAMCGTFELRFLEAQHPSMSVVFDDPFIHREIVEFFNKLAHHASCNPEISVHS